MSEFSDKLSFYISKSGYSVYQLAKVASVDRTTLQKTAKGQRLPSMDYMKDICRYIKISRKQEEELFHLYKIEKIGKATVEAWDEIHQILVDVYRLQKKTQAESLLSVHLDQKTFQRFNQNIIQSFSSGIECMKAIMCVIDEELLGQQQPEMYMDVSWGSKLVFSQLMQSGNTKERVLVCHQLVNLCQEGKASEGVIENIQKLHQILTFAFTTKSEYDVRYAYVRECEREQKYHLWAHYIITHKHVILCTQERNQMIVISNEQIAKVYRKEVEQMTLSYRPLFNYQGYEGEGVKKYRDMMEEEETHLTYEGFPCVALMVPDEIKEMIIKDEKIGVYAQAFFDMPKIRSDRFINIFGTKGLKRFIQTGHLPGIYDHYFYADSVEVRKAMIDNFRQHLIEETRQFYMINEAEFQISSVFGIEMYGRKRVTFYSTSEEYSFGFITIDEPEINEVFASYFDNLLESKYLYSKQETIQKFDEMVEMYWKEMEKAQCRAHIEKKGEIDKLKEENKSWE